MRVWIVVAVMASALAGCTDEAEPALEAESTLPGGSPHVAEDGRDLRVDLQQGDVLERPDWKVGDWFGHHIFFGPDDAEGLHINTVVVGEEGSDWVVATDNQEVSKVEAAYDIPLLGRLSKEDLSTTAFGGDWDMYAFPLSDGKTWTGRVEVDFGRTMEISFEATYDAAITSPAGTHPGFRILGLNETGTPVVETDYVPAIGWYSDFRLYEPGAYGEGRYAFRAISMGHGDAWSGTYYQHDAQELTIHDQWVGPDAGAQPGPYASFTMGDGTILYGYVYAWAATGVSQTALVAPDGTTHEARATDTSVLGGDGQDRMIDLPGQAGTWHFASVGAGAFTGGGAGLWELTEHAATMQDGAPAEA